MKLEQFNKMVQNEIQFCTDLLAKKGEEYVFSDDRLDHFKTTAASQDTNAKNALWGMLSKHLSSLSGMCKNDIGTPELWREKISDSINYLLLLWALVQEDEDNAEN